MKMYELGVDGVVNFPICDLEDSDPWKGVYLSGCEAEFPDPRLPVRYHASNQYALKDFPMAEGGYLVSGKFKRIIEVLSSSLLFFESVIYYKGSLKSKDYYRLVFTKCYDVIHKEKTVIWQGRPDAEEQKKNEIWLSIMEHVLDKKKLRNNLPGNEKIFKIKYSPIEIFLTEEAKELMESEGIKGISFKEIRVE